MSPPCPAISAAKAILRRGGRIAGSRHLHCEVQQQEGLRPEGTEGQRAHQAHHRGQGGPESVQEGQEIEVHQSQTQEGDRAVADGLGRVAKGGGVRSQFRQSGREFSYDHPRWGYCSERARVCRGLSSCRRPKREGALHVLCAGRRGPGSLPSCSTGREGRGVSAHSQRLCIV